MEFADAVDVQPGDYVIRGGRPRKVVSIKRSGRDWPYFQLESDHPTPFDTLHINAGCSDWVSWQETGGKWAPNKG